MTCVTLMPEASLIAVELSAPEVATVSVSVDLAVHFKKKSGGSLRPSMKSPLVGNFAPSPDCTVIDESPAV
jgi:hypothetical protein